MSCKHTNRGFSEDVRGRDLVNAIRAAPPVHSQLLLQRTTSIVKPNVTVRRFLFFGSDAMHEPGSNLLQVRFVVVILADLILLLNSGHACLKSICCLGDVAWSILHHVVWTIGASVLVEYRHLFHNPALLSWNFLGIKDLAITMHYPAFLALQLLEVPLLSRAPQAVDETSTLQCWTLPCKPTPRRAEMSCAWVSLDYSDITGIVGLFSGAFK
jgi:hypothetical protein